MSNEQLTSASPCDAHAAALAALALGEPLDAAEQGRLLAHLTLCGACRHRLDDYAAVGRLLPLAAPEAAPDPALRGRILEAAARGRAAAPPGARQRAGWRRLLQPALGVALAVLIALGALQAVQIAQLQAQVAEQQARTAANGRLVIAAFGNDDAVEVYLRGPDDAPEPFGRAFVSPGEPAVALYARGLQPLPAGQEYQAWVEHAGGVTSAGRFNATPEGRAWRPMRPEAALGAVRRVFVTVEPAGGSAAPTGAEVLAGAPEEP